MSQEEFEAKFPGQAPFGLPPSPSVENPGRVFPQTDPSKVSLVLPKRTTPDQFVGNPFLMNNALDKVDHALGNVIMILEQEDRSQDRGQGGKDNNALLHKFKAWRNELERIRMGEGEEDIPLPKDFPEPGSTQEGGLFTD